MPPQPSFFARLWLAIVCWFRIVFDAEFAARILAVRQGAPALPPQKPALPAEKPASPPPPAGQALHLLALLQREGRLIDFCEEDLAGFPDAQVGAAARTVHEGCRKALRSAFTFAPVRAEPEGASIAVPAGFDPQAIRLTGNLSGAPPFNGTLRHHGWKVAEVRMPTASGDPSVIAPAEVELP
jgi:uncharacterized protein DUF2760